MDDLTGKLSELLNDPKAMEQVSALAGMLGKKQEPEPPQQPTGGNNGIQALANLFGERKEPAVQNPELMETMLRILPMMNAVHQEDDITRLLHSLRPMLSPMRQKKLDEVTRLMQVFRLLPLLKSKGIL